MAVGADLMEAVDLAGVVLAAVQVGSAEADTPEVVFVVVEVGSAEADMVVADFVGCRLHPGMAVAPTVVRLA